MSNQEDSIERISKSLAQLAKMNAYQILHSEVWIEKSNGEKIYFLYQMSFPSEEIASMIGTTLGTVQKEISVRKK